MSDVLAKKLDPPFKTEMFQNNFDNSDFEHDEELQILKLEREKDLGELDSEQVEFKEFLFIDESLQQLRSDIETEKEKKHNFAKKTTNMVPQTIIVDNSQKSLIRSSTMKSIDTSQFYR